MKLNIAQAMDMTINNLSLAPKDVPVTLLMRHSLRFRIEEGTFGNEVPLTPKGRELAFVLGRRIEQPIQTVHSSPVNRCLDTAKHMLKGQAEHLQINEDERLGEPGAYILKNGGAGEEYLRLGHHQFFSNILAGKQTEGTRSIKDGSSVLLDWVTDPNKAPGINLKVTHDAILGLLIGYFLGLKEFTESQWPQMLEGMVLWQKDGQVRYAWRGEVSTTRIKNKVVYK